MQHCDLAEKPIITIAGENALIIYFTDTADSNSSFKVQQSERIIRQKMQCELSEDIIDIIPSYASILVVFNLLTTDHHRVRNKLRVLLNLTDNSYQITNQKNHKSVVELPVYYSRETGPDLNTIATRHNISIEQVIKLHQSTEYDVYAIGFAPGFAYLGEVDEKIATPRLSTPRLKVPKGAVAIADKQTAVYPNTSPGGWNIIGLCPLNMFDINATTIMPIAVGDKVRFKAITKSEFLALGGSLTELHGGIS